MSINWVMLPPSPSNLPFTPLPGERLLLTSPPRIAFSLTTPSNNYPAKQQKPYTLAHPSGTLYLTTRRILYLPDKPTPTFQSFAAPILQLHDSHVTAPFFGPNVWMAVLQPTRGGGIEAEAVEVKLVFKEGGAFDFHTGFERVKERLGQAVEVGRMDGGSSQAGVNGVDGDLEDLPAYREESEGPLISPVMAAPIIPTTVRQSQVQRSSGVAVEDDRPAPKPTDQAFEPPSEPPPGYEEAQMAGLQEEVERRRRSEGREE